MDLTKQDLVALLKNAGVKIGDYDRKTKQQLADLATVHADKIAAMHSPAGNAPDAVAVAPPPADAVVAAVGHSIKAKFPGRCKACMGVFSVGDLIARNADAKWIHASCADKKAIDAAQQPLHDGAEGPDADIEKRQAEEKAAQAQDKADAKGKGKPDADGDGDGKQPEAQPEDIEAFVVAVRDAVASNGKTGAELITKIASALVQEMQDKMGAAVDEKIAAIPQPQAAPAEPVARIINVKIGAAAAVQIEGLVHPVFQKVLALTAARQNVLLVGPAGCGKTHLAGHIAKALNQPFSANSVSGGMSESALTGYLLPVGEAGKFEYVSVPFVNAYEKGGVHLVDELDGGDANVFLVMNSALANGTFHIPHRVGLGAVQRHKDFVCIAAANTFGHGADLMYVGRNQLDAATLDRFYIVPMDYDRNYEKSIATADVCEWVWNVREKATANRIRRTVSTRMIQRMQAGIAAGLNFKTVCKDALAGWSKDDLAKVGGAA